MVDDTPAGDLAEAERFMRDMVAANANWFLGQDRARMLMAEYDRRGTELATARSLCGTLSRYLDKASDDEDALRAAHRDSIAHRDATVDRLMGRMAAVRALADDLDHEADEALRDQNKAHAAEIHELVTIANEFPKIAARIRAAVHGPAEAAEPPTSKHLSGTAVDLNGSRCGCCEIEWWLCRGLYDKGMPRCCSDCTHDLDARPDRWVVVHRGTGWICDGPHDSRTAAEQMAAVMNGHRRGWVEVRHESHGIQPPNQEGVTRRP